MMQRTAGSVRVVSGSGFRYVVPFPWRLHRMLEEADMNGNEFANIASWLPDGIHFKIHDSDAFMAQVVPLYFKQKSYKSFQRQLHFYGFQRMFKGPNQGGFYHPKFIKGDRQLTHEIDRIKAPQTRKNDGKRTITTNSTKATSSANLQTIYQPTILNGPRARGTLEWLVKTGVQFSDLEPLSVTHPQRSRNRSIGSSISSRKASAFSSTLLSLADPISLLFSLDGQLTSITPSSHQLFIQQEPEQIVPSPFFKPNQSMPFQEMSLEPLSCAFPNRAQAFRTPFHPIR